MIPGAAGRRACKLLRLAAALADGSSSAVYLSTSTLSSKPSHAQLRPRSRLPSCSAKLLRQWFSPTLCSATRTATRIRYGFISSSWRPEPVCASVAYFSTRRTPTSNSHPLLKRRDGFVLNLGPEDWQWTQACTSWQHPRRAAQQAAVLLI